MCFTYNVDYSICSDLGDVSWVAKIPGFEWEDINMTIASKELGVWQVSVCVPLTAL